ncbi:hypothetical protein [Rhodococcus wratislaviensis]|uniref:hypothetical protein n=1 Tax=Rhodococcus wratislaviensis TaxID=44752 RepID=UPI0036582B74
MTSSSSGWTQGAGEIGFDAGVTSDQRPFVERTIASLAERHSKRVEQRRTENRERTRLLREAHAPLRELIERDPEAARAVRDLRARFQPENHDADALYGSPSHDRASPQAVEFRGFELIGLPYGYDWKWKDTDGGSVAKLKADRASGTARIECRVSDVDGSSSYLTGHAGIGVVLTTDHEVAAAARAARSTHDMYNVGGGPWGGDATSEGGTEMTVFENGTLVDDGTDRRWRKRVSESEVASYDNGGFGLGDLIEVVWVMRPGNVYTLNVGAWVYSEYDNGLLGDSWARSTIDAKFLFIGLNR